jgi:glycosyltransferase involved in cell wall biosynthesis
VPARIIRQNINTMEYTGRPGAESIPAEKKLTMAKNGTRILMFIHSLDLGGSETQCVEVARQLKEEGHLVTVGCLRADGPLRTKLSESGVECVEFPVHGTLLRPNAVLQMLKLVAFICKRKFEVVHTHDLYSNLFAVPAAWLARVPVIISSRRDLSRWWWYTPARRKILRRIQGFSTRVLVNSEAVRQDLIVRDGFDPQRIFVVYNGIDLERFSRARGDRQQILPGVSPNSKNIVMVANMHIGVKGHGDLIEAARTVRERFPEARFLLAGDGEMRPFFEDQVRALGLAEMFVFLGHRTDIPQLLSCCDIGVLASKSEGLPNSVLEYLAAGLPAVATAVGGVPEIIENEVHGLLIPPENPAALATAILRLLEDLELRANLGKAGQERVRTRFNFPAVLENLRLVYEAPRRSSGDRRAVRAGSFSQVDSDAGNLPL